MIKKRGAMEDLFHSPFYCHQSVSRSEINDV